MEKKKRLAAADLPFVVTSYGSVPCDSLFGENVYHRGTEFWTVFKLWRIVVSGIVKRMQIWIAFELIVWVFGWQTLQILGSAEIN